ncbi:uncharacterized protein LOC123527809 [Mercenaria mercenaria]|uniref:uncharacterized protein LOC123527809 n=1 Tax=Mercenaria mercenaria TaxID=6596 RepID=UPI001E1E215A|nr:uncharacterized protein LOC123527809 [Mercenaria mercenaria]
MIIYVESKDFPYKSFITVVKPDDKVARVRAQMLHILYEIGREDFQFRLRYNGQYLRDVFCLTDYNIGPNAVVRMVPLSDNRDDLSDLRSISSSLTTNFDPEKEKIPSVKSALYYEIRHLNWRERLVRDMHTLLYMHSLALFLYVLTSYWYSIFWLLAYLLPYWYLIPGFTRIGGYIGNTFHRRYWFCGIVGIIGLAVMSVAIFLTVDTIKDLADDGCTNGEFTNGCSRQNMYSTFIFGIHALVLLASNITCGLLLYSFRTEVGDVIERYLVQERDIEEVMKLARSSKLKDKRTAAYEMATMAASGDDNKFRIVAEGGLDVLIAMIISNDEPTQEYAVEALSELITIQSIQDNFVEVGGVRNLTSLLHSNSPRVMQESARALYTICQSDENRHAVAEDHGLLDLANAAKAGSIETQRMVASIFLELVFNSEIRVHLTTRNTPAQALVHLCKSNDRETMRFALLTLELLAIESSDVVCAQEELLEILLDIPVRTNDNKLSLLAGKILLYFAEHDQSRENMLSMPYLKDTLMNFAKTNDPILQKVVIKVIFCMMDTRELKERARALRLDQVLTYCLDNAIDKPVWDMADQGIQVINSDEDNFPSLPVLSTFEKLGMGQNNSFGSRTSLTSNPSASGSQRS